MRFGLGFDLPQDLLDRAVGECLRFFHLAEMGFQGLRRRLGIGARLDQPQRQLLQIAGERAGLTAGAGGGLAELVGETRQALVQAFDRLFQPVLHGGALQLLQPFVQPGHVTAQLVEGLGLFAAGEGDLGRRPAHRPIHFGLAALGIVQAAADVAQLLLDTAIGMGRFGFRIRQARQHRLGLAAVGGGTKSGPCSPMLKGTEAASFAQFGDDPAGEPFPYRQALAPGRRARGFPSLGRYAGDVPGQLCTHLE